MLERWGGFDVTEAGTAAQALSLAAETRPALVVLDLNLPDRNGLDIIPDLVAIDKAIRILVFTMHEEGGYATRALDSGAHGFICKTDPPDTIIEAATAILNGAVYLSRPIAQRLALGRMASASNPLSPLTRRERDVLHLIGEGKTLAEIAANLGVSYKTVANCCSQIKNKLDLSSSAELMRVAIESG